MSYVVVIRRGGEVLRVYGRGPRGLVLLRETVWLGGSPVTTFERV